MQKILVVEDEDSIREVITLNLTMAGYDVVDFGDAEKAWDFFKQSEGVSLALLDVMLPGMDGFSLCQKLRTLNDGMGIIMLSAKSMEADKIKGLSIGADDYITKPFSVSELLARVDALLRRISRHTSKEVDNSAQKEMKLQSGEFALDLKSRILFKNSKQIDLTQVEFQIMELFINNIGTALSREQILEGVWGKEYFGDVKIVDVNMRRLRMKIEENAGDPKHILTVWGHGYRWSE